MGVFHEYKVTRRRALSLIAWLTVIPLAGIWESMVRRKETRESSKILRIMIKDIPQGISLHDKCLVNRNNDQFDTYSTTCTHLGCLLKLSGEGLLTCSCHGSVFDPLNGRVLQGPAVKPLEKLSFLMDDEFLVIDLK